MKYLCLLFLILSLKISAQTEIKGFVLSENKQPISRANVILMDSQSNISTFVFSNKDGSFLLNTDKFGDFTLQFSAMGYVKKSMPISFIKKGTVIDLETIELEADKVKEIKEVVITRTAPIKLKKDTIEYNAQQFSNGTEQNVEELLKKLPGITVQSDGKIKFGDKEVERVMIENDDLFERGYQTLTQNMPSKPLDKIQVLKNYSKNKLLKNIENTERIALNLTLKEDAKGKWFGNVLLASTSYEENRRQGKLNVMNFTKRKKVYLLFNANNLGLNEMKGVEYLINPNSENEVENVGTNISILSPVNLHQKNFQFEEKRTNFNNDQLASLNYIYNFKTGWKLKFVTVFNETENRNFVTSLYKFNYEGLNFTNTEDKVWKQNNRNIVGKMELSKEFKNNSNILFYNKVSSLNENNNNIFLFNEQLNNQMGKNQLFATENKLIYTKQIDSSQAIVAVARYTFQDRPYDFTDENDVFQFIINNPNARRINQIINSKMSFGGSKISYLKKYNENQSLEIQVGNEFRKNDFSSDLSVFDFNNQKIIFDNSPFINNINFSQNQIFAQGKFQKKHKKWNYGLALLNEYISFDFNPENKAGFYISPSINVGYENRKTGNFNLHTSRKFSTVSINDLYTNYLYQGNRNFKRSEVGFVVLPNYNAGFSYNLGDMLSEHLTFSANYFINEDYLSNNMIVNPNFIYNQSILVKNNTTLSSHIELRKYLKLLKSRISILGSYLLSEYENSINNQPLIKTEFNNLKIGFEMKSGWTSFANYELGYEWSFNKIASEINSNNYKDQKGFFNLYFTLNAQFRIESLLEYYKFGNTNQDTTQFWDVKANYNYKKYNFNVFLQGNNLLNSNSIQKYSITNISESLYTQKLIPRHIVLGINKNF
ncbi:carboxypeptidase-like regulatory domain-containing protein [Chryseobacterium gotjawalense]|uniref:Carboxypeptidase-like regulatory domain-containing protein n=1 Tax=Chryseobacterium gotjawalense TaxID=3042315 RepID=A0ABY8RER4_9FLAO|nr:carboxypeptidase-like regulatory domain-containing protein [Chryseobacterium sp. wdc7]WHF52204.1 carboxypeptidase-like regulatory domain-containing protein [Chryseobacterium sp. wdc7]